MLMKTCMTHNRYLTSQLKQNNDPYMTNNIYLTPQLKQDNDPISALDPLSLLKHL